MNYAFQLVKHNGLLKEQGTQSQNVRRATMAQSAESLLERTLLEGTLLEGTLQEGTLQEGSLLEDSLLEGTLLVVAS